ncbi:restriction endonuclease subunit S [Leucothrix pacifica]|uniref:Restriction endonuclease subunit S n=1 Tax=Leucothrix pacifica TaxID=1247513 RepID=A0A317C073_9GAMM|nr:restriction endonuclease subunit S [Leucothrix pacifica]PWQ92054.1 restriction endonuclease subunit S [Leucothrix pacifica]
MEGWVTKSISDVISKTKTIDPRKSPEKEFMYVDVSGVSNKTLEITENTKLLGKDAPSRARRVITKGDILFATVRPTLRRIAIVPSELDGEVCSTGYFVFQPTSELYNRYLFYFLQSDSFMGEMEKLQKGASYPAVNDSQVKSRLISYPSLPEQKRIVALLDTVFADLEQTRAKTEQNLKNARELFDSYLQQVFSQKGEGWKTLPLESFTNIVNGHAFKSGDFSPGNSVKSIKITNVGVYEFVEEVDNYLPKEHLEKHSKYKAYEGDIVVALTRTIISTGLKVAVVPSSYDGSLINQRVAAVQVDKDIMSTDILQAYLSTRMAIDYVKSNVNELMQPNLSIKDLKAFPIPVPPADKLNSVAKELSLIFEQKEKLVEVYNKKLNSIDELKKSILQKAFNGELTNAVA